MPNYNIVLTDQNGSDVKARLTIPFDTQSTNASNSRWHAEGGKLKYANGTCIVVPPSSEVGKKYISRLDVVLVVAGSDNWGVILENFFSGMAMTHNEGGRAAISLEWSGNTLVPGEAQWTIDDD